MRGKDFDICACGDYRHQHVEDWRNCIICTENDAMNGRACLQFRLHERFVWHWKRVPCF